MNKQTQLHRVGPAGPPKKMTMDILGSSCSVYAMFTWLAVFVTGGVKGFLANEIMTSLLWNSCLQANLFASKIPLVRVMDLWPDFQVT